MQLLLLAAQLTQNFAVRLLAQVCHRIVTIYSKPQPCMQEGVTLRGLSKTPRTYAPSLIPIAHVLVILRP